MFREKSAARRIGVSFGAALVIAALASTSQARDLLSLGAGTEIEGVARMGDRQIPLPAGKWELVMAETDRRGAEKAGNAFLARKEHGKLVAYLFVRTNLEAGGGTGRNRPRWCDRGNVHHNGSDKFHNREDADCWMLIQRVFTNKVLRVGFYNRMKDYLRENGATSTLVGNMYWRNDSYDYMLVANFFDPAVFGFPEERGKRWVESKWHKNAVGDGTPRRKFVDAVKAFGEKYREAVRQGFRGRLASGAPGLKFSFAR